MQNRVRCVRHPKIVLKSSFLRCDMARYIARVAKEGAYPLKCKHALKHHTAWYRRLDEHRHSDSNAPVKTANPPP